MINVCELHTNNSIDVVVVHSGYKCPVCKLVDEMKQIEKIIDEYEETRNAKTDRRFSIDTSR